MRKRHGHAVNSSRMVPRITGAIAKPARAGKWSVISRFGVINQQNRWAGLVNLKNPLDGA